MIPERERALAELSGDAPAGDFETHAQKNAPELLAVKVSEYAPQYDADWYWPCMNEFILPALRSAPGGLKSACLLYLIWLRFACNKNNRYKQLLLSDTLPQFNACVTEAAGLIDADVLINGAKGHIPKYFREHMLRLKSGCADLAAAAEINWRAEGDSPSLYFGDILLRDSGDISVKIRSIDTVCGSFVIEGFFSARILIDAGGSLYAKYNETEYKVTETQAFSEIRHFGEVMLKKYTIRFETADDELKPGDDISFVFRACGCPVRCRLRFISNQARLARYAHASYTLIGQDRMLRYDTDPGTLGIHAVKRFSVFVREIRYACALFGSRERLSRKFLYFALRLLYFITSPFFGGQEIWVYFDKLYKAGDNAYYLFRYAASQDDHILHRYILNKDAPEFAHMKNRFGRRVMPFRSLRQLLTSLHATEILATHSGVPAFMGLSPKMRLYFANLMHARVSCIQHGLTIQYIPDYQARMIDNTHLYFCASVREKENLMQPAYDYSEDQIRLTGCPRYDGLIPAQRQGEKIILLAPTWRRELTVDNNRTGTMKGYSPHFKQTAYFRVYDSLLQDKGLEKLLEQNGCKLLFLLHPTLTEQKSDFADRDHVRIIAASEAGYEELLTGADLLITDYSGIQFDFAYMDKPVIYFHSDELPPAYESGSFEYDKIGFGPVVRNVEGLVCKAGEAIASGFSLQTEYKRRIDDFFEHRDYENSRRVYEELLR